MSIYAVFRATLFFVLVGDYFMLLLILAINVLDSIIPGSYLPVFSVSYLNFVIFSS